MITTRLIDRLTWAVIVLVWFWPITLATISLAALWTYIIYVIVKLISVTPIT